MMETAADRTAVFQHSRPGEDKVMENAVVSEVGASPAVAGQRGGFTLVELLVVIAIMAILMALLVPAVQGVREMARQRICRGNLQMLANGVARYEDSLGYVPGWRNADSSTFGPVCWPIALLPYIEQTPVYDAFQSGGVPAVATAQIGSFLCPTGFPPDITATPAQTSYAGNVGLGTSGGVWTGVMNDTRDGANRIRLKDIEDADGTTWTLLLAEKCGPTIGPQAVWTGTLPTGANCPQRRCHGRVLRRPHPVPPQHRRCRRLRADRHGVALACRQPLGLGAKISPLRRRPAGVEIAVLGVPAGKLGARAFFRPMPRDFPPVSFS